MRAWNWRDARDWRTQLLTIAVITLAFALLFQGNRGLWGVDEARYSNVALHMLESGDWLTPHRHPEHIEYSKPPLSYWAVALSLKLFGNEEWAIRLPSALSFFGTTILCFLISLRLHAKKAWLAPVMYATNAVPFLAANYGGADSLLTFFVTLGMYAFVSMWHSEDTASARNFRRLMWAAFALAFLCKGPAALLPLLALMLFRRFSGLKFPCSSVGFDGPILFLLLTLPWFIWMFGRGETSGIVEGNQALVAMRGSYQPLVESQNSAPWYGGFVIYGPVIILGLLPWGLLALILALSQYRSAVRGYFSRLKMQRFRQIHQESVFLLSWFCIPLVVLFVVQVRVYLFMLPLLVAQALIVGRALQYVSIRRWMAVALALWALMLLGIKGFAPYYNQNSDARVLAAAIHSKFGDVRGQTIAVFESAPAYGLKFYLGANLLRISNLQPKDASYDLLLHQALHPEKGQPLSLWMVESARLSEFDAALIREHFTVDSAVEVPPFQLLKVRPR